ncbi:hypothetical protein Tco_0547981 [Tanacetum coccineum]
MWLRFRRSPSRCTCKMDVIVNGDLEEEPAPTTRETSAPPAPKTAKQLATRRNQERVKSILLLAIPMNTSLSFTMLLMLNLSRSLDKAYDRFQKLISQLEVHGAPISKEDINQKFLRSLPSSWNQIALIMINKPDIDEIDIDDLYNNLRVYEDELKSTASGDFGVSTAGGLNQVPSTLCAHDVAYSFQQIDGDDLKELDLQWQVAILTGYELALESLESWILGHEKNEMAWGEKYEFQNYDLKCREIKINNLNLELEKVVKERDELKDKIAKWEESTKNLDEILNSQMSARDKTGLGYSTQLNELSSNHETDIENSLSVFDVRSSDEENTSENDRFYG